MLRKTTDITNKYALEIDETVPQGIAWKELWLTIRPLLLLWSLAVWVLLVFFPSMEQITDFGSALMHLPGIFIGMGLLAAMFAAYNLGFDGHLLWFLGVLLLLAGWI